MNTEAKQTEANVKDPEKEQFVFAISSGLVLLLLAVPAVFITPAGWNLMVVGAGITVLALWKRFSSIGIGEKIKAKTAILPGKPAGAQQEF